MGNAPHHSTPLPKTFFKIKRQRTIRTLPNLLFPIKLPLRMRLTASGRSIRRGVLAFQSLSGFQGRQTATASAVPRTHVTFQLDPAGMLAPTWPKPKEAVQRPAPPISASPALQEAVPDLVLLTAATT
jgi:hypothetical protein